MLIISQLIHVFAISLFMVSAYSEDNLSREQQMKDKVKLQGQLNKKRLDELQLQINNMDVQIQNDFVAKGQKIIELEAQATKKMQQLKQIGKEIHAWSEFLKKVNEYVTKGNNAMISFNEKISGLMAKMVGFEQQMKTIVNMDTIIVCILSLVLIKILKDEFIDEGYQPVRDSTLTSNGQMSSSITLGERELNE